MTEKAITVQIKPDLLSSKDAKEVLALLLQSVKGKKFVDGPVITEGKEDGGFLNVKFVATDLPLLWQVLQRDVLEKSAAARKASVVICTGKTGWHDYLLLHHHDPSQKLDSLQ